MDTKLEELRTDLHQTYNGGNHSVESRAAFHQGMDTVINVLSGGWIDANFISKSELTSMTKDCGHDSRSHCLEMECYVHEKGGYNEALRDAILLINKP